jgi:excisionase family DNA binding protein
VQFQFVYRGFKNLGKSFAIPHREDRDGRVSTLVERQLADAKTHQETTNSIVILLLARFGDCTHLSVREAANALGCSVPTVRRKIAAGTLTLETVPGMKEGGIPIEQLYARWIDIRAARAAMERAKREIA